MTTSSTRALRSVLSELQELRDRTPDRQLFTFVDENGVDEETLTAHQLASAAESVAESLRKWGLAPGDRAVLVYPPGSDFLKAIFGCLIAGLVPVPLYPPDPFNLKKQLAGFTAMVTDCGARVALTNTAYDRARTVSSVAGFFDKGRPSWPDIRWHRTDRCPAASSSPVTWHEPQDPDEPALLQYTSGSTGTPRGVVITHGNLISEVTANAVDLDLGEGSIGVSWLPQYHDLGLISVILSTAVGNAHSYLLSPLTFLRRPAVWFDVMSRVRGTHSAAPNFAFELAVRKTTPEQRASWDLSSVRVLMSAAEPIRPKTVQTFFDAFAVSGLSREAFYPAYGLAENAVGATMGGKIMLVVDKQELEKGRAVPVTGEPDRPTTTCVGCGKVTKPGSRVRIVDPDSRKPCPDGQIGEIWVDSPTKALGYYDRPEETEETFHARVDDAEDSRHYLRTGDLGFWYDGELFPTGRLKDLIIVRGRNVYPQDIEDSIREAHPRIRPGGVVAFSIPAPEDSDSGEQLVVLVETKKGKITSDERAAIQRVVRERIYADHQLACDIVVVGAEGMVRKTTSGKVRRRSCREAFLSGAISSSPQGESR